MSSWLQAFIGNMIAAEQLDELRQLNENGGSQRREFDWDNQALKDGIAAIIESFKKAHPEVPWGTEKGLFKKHFPEKDKGVDTLSAMANEGRINELEFLALYKEIFNVGNELVV